MAVKVKSNGEITVGEMREILKMFKDETEIIFDYQGEKFNIESIEIANRNDGTMFLLCEGVIS